MVVIENFLNEKYNEFVNFLAHRLGELMKESRNTYYLKGLSIFFLVFLQQTQITRTQMQVNLYLNNISNESLSKR